MNNPAVVLLIVPLVMTLPAPAVRHRPLAAARLLRVRRSLRSEIRP
ncbi:hypothetical protein SAMN05421810_101816 [Amycolatopsis arida]|uniref:Uncharacterized protein n=1 Tax=Amycolatopsis arida TaxID=587909 RepID=A0A1I5M8A3_9PSEU|nr:hypothetical protein CLV69_104448 [Amycolatopsis arida]SFP05231.1 hypothetical protein SAMN05421810_101816 [Amycolatopsis arida]